MASKKNFIQKNRVTVFLGILALALVLYYYRSLFIAASVNGKPISRMRIINELERRNGAQVIDSFITETLIFQEASKAGIKVTQDDVNAEITQIEQSLSEQGQTLDDILAFQGLSRSDFEGQVRLQVAVEKLLADRIQVTDEEIDNYIEENGDFLPESSEGVDRREVARQQLEQQKLSQEFQTWMQEVRENSNINYFVDYAQVAQ